MAFGLLVLAGGAAADSVTNHVTIDPPRYTPLRCRCPHGCSYVILKASG
jgi:hypothetical protein